MTTTTRPRAILLVEDDPANQMLVRRALDQSMLDSRLSIASDGAEALDYLERSASDPPDLVLVDLNMPTLNGHEVVRRLRADPRFRSLPIVVLTTSTEPSDIADSYILGANSYVVKPAKFEELCRVLDILQQYWFRTVALPPAG